MSYYIIYVILNYIISYCIMYRHAPEHWPHATEAGWAATATHSPFREIMATEEERFMA